MATSRRARETLPVAPPPTPSSTASGRKLARSARQDANTAQTVPQPNSKHAHSATGGRASSCTPCTLEARPSVRQPSPSIFHAPRSRLAESLDKPAAPRCRQAIRAVASGRQLVTTCFVSLLCILVVRRQAIAKQQPKWQWTAVICPVTGAATAVVASLALSATSSGAPFGVAAVAESSASKASVKIGVLLEESDHEQANMFIRTIKMINEQKDETISRLLGMFAVSARGGGGPSRAHGSGASLKPALTGGGWRRPPPGSPNQAAATTAIGPDEPDSLDQSIGSGVPEALLAASRQQWKQQRQRHHSKHEYRAKESISTVGNAAAPSERPPSSVSFASIFGEIFGASSARPAEQGLSPVALASASHANDDDEPAATRSPFNIRLEPMIEFLADRQSALEADQKVCQLVESGVRAVMGPGEGASIQHVQSICDNLEIPYFELRSFLGGALWAPPLGAGPAAATKSATMPLSSSSNGAQTSVAVVSRTSNGQAIQENAQQTMATLKRRPALSSGPGAAAAAADVGQLRAARSICGPQNVAGRKQQAASGVNMDSNNGCGPQDNGAAAFAGPAQRDNHDDDDDDDHHHHHDGGGGGGDGRTAAGQTTPSGGGDQPTESAASNSRGSNASQTRAPHAERATTRRFAKRASSSAPAAKSADGSKLAPTKSGPDGGRDLPNSDSEHYDDESGASDDDSNSDLYATLGPEQPATAGGDAQPTQTSNGATGQVMSPGWSGVDRDDRLGDINYAQNSTAQRKGEQVPVQQLVSPANKLDDITLNLYPPGHLLNYAYIDLIYALNWTSFAVVYEDSSSMIKLQDLFRESAGSWNNRWRIKLFRVIDALNDNQKPTDFDSGYQPAAGSAGDSSHQSSGAVGQLRARRGTMHDSETNFTAPQKNQEQLAKFVQYDEPIILNDAPIFPSQQAKRNRQGLFRDVFWRVKLSGEFNVLLDVKTENLYDALKQAQQVGCMTEEYNYLITSLDLHMVDLEDFKYSRTKITGFSIIQVAKSQQSSLRSSTRFTAQDGLLFDEKYLENLGVHSTSQSLAFADSAWNSHGARSHTKQKSARNNNNAVGRPSTSDAIKSSLNDYTAEAENNDHARREMLQSSPASLGLLPTVDRNNEQRLFDFFVEQQERNTSRVRISTASAILHDSLILYMLALNELDPSGTMISSGQTNIACSLDSQPWPHGSTLVNYMRHISFNGLSGSISFDQRGLRTDFKLDVMGMAPNIRLIKVGEWHSRRAQEVRHKFELQQQHQQAQQQQKQKQQESQNFAPAIQSTTENVKSYDELSQKYEDQFRKYARMISDGEKVDVPYAQIVSPNGALKVNEILFDRLFREQADQIDTLVVTAILSQPYFMLKETPNKLDGNDQYEGYAVDLIHELSKLVNFRYRWREVADKKYGSKESFPNGTVVWNGMIGEIVRGQADLAIVDLTITTQRQEAVDFTLPFMNTGISILFKKPTTKVTTLFSFLSPFSSDVWAYVLAAYCGISAILFLVGHISPYEWADPHPCGHLNQDDEVKMLKNQFSLLNSFWFTIGSLMQQGSDLTPRSMSTRTIAGIWYFFTLIMISSYTANLAAFLTVEKVVYPIENVRDLSNQQEIKYGCVDSGSTCLFFHDSQIDTYRKINQTMHRYSTYVRSNDEGQKRVGEGKFAFFMESTTIEYIVERNCNLTQIGGLIDSKGYGLATSKKPRYKRPYRTLLNEGILHLQETGMLHVLKNRWWKERRGGGTCTDDGKGGGVTELSLANVGGVFVVLLGGLGISFLVAIAEFMWRAKRSGSSRDRMCEEMMNDLKFALACKSSTKPARKRASSRARRRLQRQQESILSQYDDKFLELNPNTEQNGHRLMIQKNKDCDPILLHAMLTMLMQQQQNQNQNLNQNQNQAATRMGTFATSVDVVSENKNATLPASGSDPMVSSVHVYQHGRPQQVSTADLSHRSTMPHSATIDGIMSRQLNSNDLDVNYCRNLPGDMFLLQQQQHQQIPNWMNDTRLSDTMRRRILHAQKTIDMTDE